MTKCERLLDSLETLVKAPLTTPALELTRDGQHSPHLFFSNRTRFVTKWCRLTTAEVVGFVDAQAALIVPAIHSPITNHSLSQSITGLQAPALVLKHYSKR